MSFFNDIIFNKKYSKTFLFSKKDNKGRIYLYLGNTDNLDNDNLLMRVFSGQSQYDRFLCEAAFYRLFLTNKNISDIRSKYLKFTKGLEDSRKKDDKII